MKNSRDLLYFIASFAVCLAAARWAQGLFLESEYLHFSVNFPTAGAAPTRSRFELGGPWSRLGDEEWHGYPAGGLLVWGQEGAIRVDVGKQGLLKRLVQPRDVTISTHWLRNVGTRPYRIQLELEMCGLPLVWETFERDWDDQAKTATRPLTPGKTFNMDWHFRLPPDWRDRELICAGSLRVIDADTHALLTSLPITVANSGRGSDSP